MGLSEIVKDVVPGSIEFLLLGLIVGAGLVGLRREGARRWGRRGLLALFMLYAVLSLHGTSALLLRGLSGERPVSTLADARGARTIVVLGNGSFRHQVGSLGVDVMSAQTAYNVLETARLATVLPDARVMTSGGPSTNNLGSESVAIAEALVALGVSRTRIDHETGSRNTFQQATRVARLLGARGERTFVLVTTPEHMRRARGVFTELGLDPVPSPSAIVYGEPPFWRPSRHALQGSQNALYEYLACVLYSWRGWM